jgi:hypothetical protein
LAVVAAAGVAAAGCAESVSPDVGGYSTVYADTVPPDIYTYPHTYFSGGYAYMVGDSWYYPRQGRWVRLRSEPPELHRFRAQSGFGRPGAAEFQGGPRGGRPMQVNPANRSPTFTPGPSGGGRPHRDE